MGSSSCTQHGKQYPYPAWEATPVPCMGGNPGRQHPYPAWEATLGGNTLTLHGRQPWEATPLPCMEGWRILTLQNTRMHSSRMCTACSSSHHGGGSTTPPGVHTPQSKHPLEQTPPPPQSRHTSPSQIPLNFPLGCGLDQILLNFPLGCGPGPDPLNFPLGCGPGPDPPKLHPWLWAWKHARHTTPPHGDLLQGMLGYHLQCMLG